MLDTKAFGDLLFEHGFSEFVGVPCSFLAPLINYALNHNRFFIANNEGDAIALASGISLAHLERKNPKFGVVLMQNSGLSNALSPLTSLNYTFKIPILGFVSLRGERDVCGKNTDEPQHELLGRVTDRLLEVCDIDYLFLSDNIDDVKKQLVYAKAILKKGRAFFFIVRNHVLHNVALCASAKMDKALPTRLDTLNTIQDLAYKNNAIVLATTGKTGRELYEIADTPNQLYMVGSMGCVSSLGLGLCLQTQQKVIAVDGDCALLMRLGALAHNAYFSKLSNRGNFCHVVLDNQCHDSTGAQASLSPYIDFSSIAKACGYECVQNVTDTDELKDALTAFLKRHDGGASFIYQRIAQGSKKDLGRPKTTPKEVARRLAQYMEKNDV